MLNTPITIGVLIMFICMGCKKEFETNNKRKGHHARCKEWELFKDKILTYDVLYQKYIVEGKSANSIAIEFAIGHASMIIAALKKFNIKTRTISESTKSEFVREKYKKTNLERYGHEHNFSKNHPSRKKWEQKMFEEEGIVNVFQREDVIKKIKINLFNSDKHLSSIHEKILDILTMHNIDFDIELPIKNIKGYKYYDVYIKGTNKLIEVNGDFWHANPEKYSENDVLNFPGHPRIAKNIWAEDLKKKELANKHGYDILYIWEKEFSDLTLVENKVLKYIKENINEN
jgi:hypothetical protein